MLVFPKMRGRRKKFNSAVSRRGKTASFKRKCGRNRNPRPFETSLAVYGNGKIKSGAHAFLAFHVNGAPIFFDKFFTKQ